MVELVDANRAEIIAVYLNVPRRSYFNNLDVVRKHDTLVGGVEYGVAYGGG